MSMPKDILYLQKVEPIKIDGLHTAKTKNNKIKIVYIKVTELKENIKNSKKFKLRLSHLQK